MSTKFHINKNGVPAPCRAKPGNCPYGGEDSHFKTQEEAQARANELNEAEFGLFSHDENSTFRSVADKDDKAYVVDRFKVLQKREDQKRRSTRGKQGNYMGRCRDAEEIPDYEVNNVETAHYRKDRTSKEKRLARTFGKGKIIGYYRVNHVVDTENGKDIYANQTVEIRDNGRIAIYDYNDGRKVTTFMAHQERVEVMMLHSGQIPDESFLKKVEDNFKKESRHQAAIKREKDAAIRARALAAAQ